MPANTLNINCNPVGGVCTTPAQKDYTSATFGTVVPTSTTTGGVQFGGAQVQARHAAASVRFRF